MPQLLKITLNARIRAFASDLSGVAAVEFAYLAPLLMLMTFGTFELTRALLVHKHFQRTTAMVADLVAREDKLWLASGGDPSNPPSIATQEANSKAALAGIMISAEHVMEPYDAAPLQLRVYQVWASPTDATQSKIEWSYQYRTGATVGCGDPVTMANGLLQPSARALIVEAQYQYAPILKNILPGFLTNVNWTDKMILTPRQTPTIEFLQALNNQRDWTTQGPDPTPCN